MTYRFRIRETTASTRTVLAALALGLAAAAGGAQSGGLEAVDASLRAWQTGEARSALEKVYDTGNAEHLNAMGEILVQEGKLDEAKSKFQRAAEVAPADPEAWVLLGRLHARLKNREASEAAYRKAADLARQRVGSKDAGAESHLWLGTALLGQGQLDAAVEHLKHARDAKPADPRPHYYLGLASTFQKKWQEAIESLGKALERDGRYAYALYYRGVASSQINRKGDMLADLEKFVFLAPSAPEAETARQLIRSAKG